MLLLQTVAANYKIVSLDFSENNAHGATSGIFLTTVLTFVDKEASYVPTKTHPRHMMCLWREIVKKKLVRAFIYVRVTSRIFPSSLRRKL